MKDEIKRTPGLAEKAGIKVEYGFVAAKAADAAGAPAAAAETGAGAAPAPAFTAAELLASRSLRPLEKDVLRAVLEPERMYTWEEAKQEIAQYAERMMD